MRVSSAQTFGSLPTMFGEDQPAPHRWTWTRGTGAMVSLLMFVTKTGRLYWKWNV